MPATEVSLRSGSSLGISLAQLILAEAQIGADTSAKYATFRCDDNYVISIDMPTEPHPQTHLRFWFDGKVLPRKYGFQMKLPNEARV